MRRILPTLTAVILLALVVSPPALAEDLWQGPADGSWARGDPGSTWQHWDFCDPQEFIPCMFENEYGPPEFQFESPTQWQWSEHLPGPAGHPVPSWWTPDDGTMIFHVPNRPELDEIKKIFLQITSTKGPAGVTAFGFDSAGGSGWEVELSNGSTEKYYAELPAEIGSVSLHFPQAPKYHLGREIGETGIETLSRMYIDYLQELVAAAVEKFKSS